MGSCSANESDDVAVVGGGGIGSCEYGGGGGIGSSSGNNGPVCVGERP